MDLPLAIDCAKKVKQRSRTAASWTIKNAGLVLAKKYIKVGIHPVS
jgi:hypothetical protein